MAADTGATGVATAADPEAAALAGLDRLEIPQARDSAGDRAPENLGRGLAQAARDRDRARRLGARPPQWLEDRHPARAGRRLLRPVGSRCTTPLLWQAIGTTLRRAVIGFALALVIGVVDRGAGVPDQAAAGGGRLDDHRAADHAVDRLVPVRDHPVRRHHHRHPVRHRAGRRPVDRQRADHRRGLHPAAAAAGGPHHGAGPDRDVPAPDPARLAALVRGRPQAGLGVRLAQPDGRRTAGHHPRPAVHRRACSPPTRTRATWPAPSPS